MPDWDDQNTLIELTAKVASMEEKTEKMESAMEDTKKEKEEMAKKKGMEDKEKKDEEKEAGNKLGKHKMTAAILQAMEEEDPDKRKAAVKKAMDEEEEKKEGEDDDKNKKMEEQKAQIDSLTRTVAAPKITYLGEVYKQTGLEEDKITEMKAGWEKMSIVELEAEVTRIKPFIDSLESQAATQPAGIPVGPTVSPMFSGSVKKDDYMAKIEKADAAELFNGGIA